MFRLTDLALCFGFEGYWKSGSLKHWGITQKWSNCPGMVPGIKFTSTSARPVSLFYTYRNSCSISLASSLFSVIDDIPTHSNESLHRQLYNFCTHNTVSLGFVSWTLRTSMKNTISFFQFYKKKCGGRCSWQLPFRHSCKHTGGSTWAKWCNLEQSHNSLSKPIQVSTGMNYHHL